MKKLLPVFIVMFSLMASLASTQTFTLTVQNQQISGNEFTFDIYLLRTGVTDIYLGNSDFALTFNEANFSSDTFTKVQQGDGSNRLAVGYTYAVSIQSPGVLLLNVQPPGVGDQSNFDNRIQVISNTGNGEKIGTFKVTTISNPGGSAGLTWKTVIPNKTIITTMASADPWAETDISTNGTYTNPSDQSLPVSMRDFYAESSQEEGIVINWSTASESNTLGFNVLRSTTESGKYAAINGSLIAALGEGSSGADYSYADKDITEYRTYWYKIEEIAGDGSTSYFGPISAMGVNTIPSQFAVSQNYPNPFNPETTIHYQIPHSTTINAVVYSLLGQKVKTLKNGYIDAGFHSVVWDGTNDLNQNVPSGVYFIQIRTTEDMSTRKMTLLR